MLRFCFLFSLLVLLISPALAKSSPAQGNSIQVKPSVISQAIPPLKIEHKRLPTLVWYYADWCPYCRMMEPSIEKSQAKFKGKVYFHIVNVDSPDNKKFVNTQRPGGGGIPYTQFYDKHGKYLDDMTGAIPEETLMGKMVINFNLL